MTPNTALSVRAAQSQDIEPLSVLCTTVWIDTYSFDGIEPSHARYVLTQFSPTALQQQIKQKTVFVARNQDNPVGVIIIHPGNGEIETLYVLPRYQSQGVGRLLLQHSKQQADTLFLTCWEGNHKALAFYQRQGFIEDGEFFFELEGKKIRNIRLILEDH